MNIEVRTDCEYFEAKEHPNQCGSCQTDGHYLCIGCRHIASFEDMELSDNRMGYYSKQEMAAEFYKQEVAKEREKAKKLVELLHEIDKSLYIGDDLNDIVILKWYLDVIGTIKDEIKKSLTEYEK